VLEWRDHSEAWSRSWNLRHQQANSEQTDLVLVTIQVHKINIIIIIILFTAIFPGEATSPLGPPLLIITSGYSNLEKAILAPHMDGSRHTFHWASPFLP